MRGRAARRCTTSPPSSPATSSAPNSARSPITAGTGQKPCQRLHADSSRVTAQCAHEPFIVFSYTAFSPLAPIKIGTAMRLSLRFLIPLALALGAIAYGVVPLVDELTLKWFVRDLDIRTKLIACAAQEPLVELLTDNARDRVRLQRVQALLQPHPAGRAPVRARLLRRRRQARLPHADAAGGGRLPRRRRRRRRMPGAWCKRGASALHVAAAPIMVDGQRLGELLIVHDMSFVERRSADTKKYIFYLFAAHRRGDRADHGGDRGAVVPRLDGGHQGADPRPVARAVARAEVARAAADRARPGGAGARARGRAAHARRIADQLDAGDAAHASCART